MGLIDRTDVGHRSLLQHRQKAGRILIAGVGDHDPEGHTPGLCAVQQREREAAPVEWLFRGVGEKGIGHALAVSC
jgi:hypothetical protein